MEKARENVRRAADMGGNLVAGAAACAMPERGDLCGHAHGRHG
jgi:hypothetical protein